MENVRKKIVATIQIHNEDLCHCTNPDAEQERLRDSCPWLWFGFFERDTHRGLYWDFTTPRYSTHTITAMDSRGRLLGLFRFDVSEDDGCRLLESGGTYVVKRCRKRGLAEHLWTVALEYIKPDKVRVMCVSDTGYTLVHTILKRFPDIIWVVYAIGARPLRNMKRGTKR